MVERCKEQKLLIFRIPWCANQNLHMVTDILLVQVLDSPFARLKDLMVELCEEQKLPIPRAFMRLALSMMRRSVRKRAGFSIEDVSPLDVVPGSFIPALFGERAPFIPALFGECLYAPGAVHEAALCANAQLQDGDVMPPHVLLSSIIPALLGTAPFLAAPSSTECVGLRETGANESQRKTSSSNAPALVQGPTQRLFILTSRI